MNYKYIINVIGKVLLLDAVFMLLPIIVGIIYKEPFNSSILSYLISAVLSASIGILFNASKAKNYKINAKSGFIIVTFSWLFMSLFGALPLVLSQQIPNFFDAFFEMSSGFSTTGASILRSSQYLDGSVPLLHSTFFWRSFSHFVGGMGVIVFILAIMPEAKEGSSMHILRAESPGPQVGKLVSKMSATARILYLLYMVFTLAEFIMLWVGPDEKMDVFSSLCMALGTAGTGGFGLLSDSCASYASYTQYVIGAFMFLFGINFSLYYLLLIGNIKAVVKNEEARVYGILFTVCVFFIAIMLTVKNVYTTFGESFKHSFFQVASIISTTGFATTDYAGAVMWPTVCIIIIIFFTFTGACAGSTAGGLKLSRINILFKSAIRKTKEAINPRRVELLKDGTSVLDEDIINTTQVYFLIYIILLIATTFIISFDGFDILTNFTASLACLSNVGPGLNMVGPAGNYLMFSDFSKFILSIAMITGRLELFPVIVLFNRSAWKN